MLNLQIVATAVATNAPVMGVLGDRSINENSLLSFTLSANDPDNDSLTFSAINLPSGSSLNNSTGLFEWIPNYDQSGSYLTQFVVSDGSHIDSEYITITVNNANRLSIFSPIPDTTVDENSQVKVILNASDPDGDLLVFSKDVTFGNLQNNVFTWTPNYDDEGEHTIVFTVNDGFSSVTQTAMINVSNVNREPTFYSIGDTSVLQNETVTIQLNAYDPDGDTLVYSNASDLLAGASLDSNTGLFQWVNTDSPGAFSQTFTITDGSTSKTKIAKIVVGDSNSVPVLKAMETQYVEENSELAFEIEASDNDTLSFSYPNDFPSGAILTMNGSSVKFSWIPSYSQAGNYKVEFRVSDDSYAEYEVVDIVVSDVNQAPVINPVTNYTQEENSVLNIALTAIDSDGDTLTFSTNSSLGIVRGNTFICTPGYSDSGLHDILFTVSDGSLTNSTTATITVNDVNMPPKINQMFPLEVSEGDTLNFSLAVEDIDVNNVFTYSALNLPSGSNFDGSTGQFTWTPSSDQQGTYSVSFHVNDGDADDYETVSITVTEPSSSTSSTSSASSSGGGGGGGGSMNTGEEFENIDLKDYKIKYVNKDMESLFEFDEPANSIMSVGFVSRLNGGQTKAVVEMLKETSTLVKKAPAGEVYKNLNIWVGDSKFPSDMISNVVIKFKVERPWVISNDYDSKLVKLYRYSNGMWNSLETSEIDEDEDYFYYEASSPGFSPFAIIMPENSKIVMIENSSPSNEQAKMSIGDDIILDEEGDASQDHKRSLMFLLLFGSIVAVAAVGVKYRSHYERLYLQIANPDGKRYRRIKK